MAPTVEQLLARIEALEARLARHVNGQLSDQSVYQIVDAMEKTVQMKWVQAKMDVEAAQDSYLFGGEIDDGR